MAARNQDALVMAPPNLSKFVSWTIHMPTAWITHALECFTLLAPPKTTLSMVRMLVMILEKHHHRNSLSSSVQTMSFMTGGQTTLAVPRFHRDTSFRSLKQFRDTRNLSAYRKITSTRSSRTSALHRVSTDLVYSLVSSEANVFCSCAWPTILQSQHDWIRLVTFYSTNLMINCRFWLNIKSLSPCLMACMSFSRNTLSRYCVKRTSTRFARNMRRLGWKVFPSHYVVLCLSQLQLHSQKILSTKGDPDPHVQAVLQKDMVLSYRQGVGELIYVMVTHLPYISFAVVKFA